MNFECNLCKSQKKPNIIRSIDTPDRFERQLRRSHKGYERYWVRCAECGAGGHVMDNETTRIVSEIADKYYDLDLGGLSDLEDKYQRVMGLPDEKSDNAGRSKRVARWLADTFSEGRWHAVSICDIGSGLGLFPSKLLNVAIDYNVTIDRCVAVETDPLAFEFLSRFSGFEVLNGFFPDVVLEEMFSVITLNKVLEHIRQPRDLLKSCLQHLEEGGFLYLEVPCLSNAWLKPDGDDSIQTLHHNLYDIPALSRLLYEEGFMVVRAERINEPSGKITTYAFAQRLSDLNLEWVK